MATTSQPGDPFEPPDHAPADAFQSESGEHVVLAPVEAPRRVPPSPGEHAGDAEPRSPLN
jgi:hypothetical protein